MDPSILIVGAGLSGAVIARELAEAGLRVRVVEARDHVAGNCHTERDPATGVMVHVYGPHIFHTDDAEVWDHVGRFARFRPYRHRVMATTGGRVYALPVNLHTINQLFGTAMDPDQARAFLAARSVPCPGGARSFEERGLELMGPDLYQAFFAGYTAKQWGRAPSDLPAGVLNRLPFRLSYDDNYFAHRFQGIPEEGYTEMVARMFDHPAITLELGRSLRRDEAAGHDHVFQTGPLDGWFGHDLGRLGYRTLRFERIDTGGEGQGCAVMNWPDPEVPWTRVTEHRHFAPWESHRRTVLHREYSAECGPGDTPFYPVRLAAETALLRAYVARAEAERGVTFVGRLGTYRYLDMDVCVREALDCARLFLARRKAGGAMPAFAVRPL